MAIRTTEVLVGTEEVAAQLGDPNRRLLEVDEDTEAYGRGHIPGALAVHWRHDLQDPVRREFIGPQAFAALMDRLGIGNDTPVVLYGGNNNWFAAYAYWYFRYYRHQAVTLMDGGRKKWELERRPFTQRVPEVAATSGYRVAGPVSEIRALRDQVERGLGSSGRGLVDVRSPEEYRGELLAPPHLPQEQAQRPGHIPGARNIPWVKAVDSETGAFLPAERLRSLNESQGVTPDLEVVASCRIGSVRRTPGSCCMSCWATRGCATTTAPGPSGAPWWASPSTVTYVIPLWSTVLGALLLGERVGWNVVAGGLLVVYGVALTRERAFSMRARVNR